MQPVLARPEATMAPPADEAGTKTGRNSNGPRRGSKGRGKRGQRFSPAGRQRNSSGHAAIQRDQEQGHEAWTPSRFYRMGFASASAASVTTGTDGGSLRHTTRALPSANRAGAYENWTGPRYYRLGVAHNSASATVGPDGGSSRHTACKLPRAKAGKKAKNVSFASGDAAVEVFDAPEDTVQSWIFDKIAELLGASLDRGQHRVSAAAISKAFFLRIFQFLAGGTLLRPSVAAAAADEDVSTAEPDDGKKDPDAAISGKLKKRLAGAAEQAALLPPRAANREDLDVLRELFVPPLSSGYAAKSGGKGRSVSEQDHAEWLQLLALSSECGVLYDGGVESYGQGLQCINRTQTSDFSALVYTRLQGQHAVETAFQSPGNHPVEVAGAGGRSALWLQLRIVLKCLELVELHLVRSQSWLDLPLPAAAGTTDDEKICSAKWIHDVEADQGFGVADGAQLQQQGIDSVLAGRSFELARPIADNLKTQGRSVDSILPAAAHGVLLALQDEIRSGRPRSYPACIRWTCKQCGHVNTPGEGESSDEEEDDASSPSEEDTDAPKLAAPGQQQRGHPPEPLHVDFSKLAFRGAFCSGPVRTLCLRRGSAASGSSETPTSPVGETRCGSHWQCSEVWQCPHCGRCNVYPYIFGVARCACGEVRPG